MQVFFEKRLFEYIIQFSKEKKAKKFPGKFKITWQEMFVVAIKKLLVVQFPMISLFLAIFFSFLFNTIHQICYQSKKKVL